MKNYTKPTIILLTIVFLAGLFIAAPKITSNLSPGADKLANRLKCVEQPTTPVKAAQLDELCTGAGLFVVGTNATEALDVGPADAAFTIPGGNTVFVFRQLPKAIAALASNQVHIEVIPVEGAPNAGWIASEPGKGPALATAMSQVLASQQQASAPGTPGQKSMPSAPAPTIRIQDLVFRPADDTLAQSILGDKASFFDGLFYELVAPADAPNLETVRDSLRQSRFSKANASSIVQAQTPDGNIFYFVRARNRRGNKVVAFVIFRDTPPENVPIYTGVAKLNIAALQSFPPTFLETLRGQPDLTQLAWIGPDLPQWEKELLGNDLPSFFPQGSAAEEKFGNPDQAALYLLKQNLIAPAQVAPVKSMLANLNASVAMKQIQPIDTLIEQLQDRQSVASETLAVIYAPYGEQGILNQMKRYRTALQRFQQLYPQVTSVAIARSGGRVVETGEHSDYHHGLVLNSPTLLDTVVITGANEASDQITVNSTLPDRFQEGTFSNSNLAVGHTSKVELQADKWFYYVQSTLNQMHKQMGIKIPGLCMLVDGRRGETPEEIAQNAFGALPISAGLSSSAALDVASSISVLGAIEKRSDVTASELTVATTGAENAIGFPCGPQDPWGAMRGWLEGAAEGKFYAQVMDCLPQVDSQGKPLFTAKLVEMPANLQAVLINTGTKSPHAQGKFAARLDGGMIGGYILAHSLSVAQDILRNQGVKVVEMPIAETPYLTDHASKVFSDMFQAAYPQLTQERNEGTYPPFYKPYYFSLEALHKIGYPISEADLMSYLAMLLPDSMTRDTLISLLGKMMLSDIIALRKLRNIEGLPEKAQAISAREAVDIVMQDLQRGTERPFDKVKGLSFFQMATQVVDMLDRDQLDPVNIDAEENAPAIERLGKIAFDRFTWTTRAASDPAVNADTRKWNILGPTRHAITEQKRVRDTVQALRTGDLEAYGQIQGEVYESLKSDYRNTDAVTEALVGFANGLPEVLGARHIGAGWGGNLAVWVKAEDTTAVMQKLLQFVSSPKYKETLATQIYEQQRADSDVISMDTARERAGTAVKEVEEGIIQYIPGPGADLVFTKDLTKSMPEAPMSLLQVVQKSMPTEPQTSQAALSLPTGVFTFTDGLVEGADRHTIEVDSAITAELERIGITHVATTAGLQPDIINEALLRQITASAPALTANLSTITNPADAVIQINAQLEAMIVLVQGGIGLLIQPAGTAIAIQRPAIPIQQAVNDATKLIITDLDALVMPVGQTPEGAAIYAPTTHAIEVIADMNTLANITNANGGRRYYRAVYSNRLSTEQIAAVLAQAGIPASLFDVGILSGDIVGAVARAATAVEQTSGIAPDLLFRMAEQNQALLAAIAANTSTASMIVQVIMQPSDTQYFNHRQSLIAAIKSLEGIVPAQTLDTLMQAVQGADVIRGTVVEPEDDDARRSNQMARTLARSAV